MSGGSYDYLCFDLERGEGVEKFLIHSERLLSDLRDATIEVAGRSSARECAALVAAVLLVKSARAGLLSAREILRELADVVRAVEWWQSGDCDVDSVVRACMGKFSPADEADRVKA